MHIPPAYANTTIPLSKASTIIAALPPDQQYTFVLTAARTLTTKYGLHSPPHLFLPQQQRLSLYLPGDLRITFTARSIALALAFGTIPHPSTTHHLSTSFPCTPPPSHPHLVCISHPTISHKHPPHLPHGNKVLRE